MNNNNDLPRQTGLPEQTGANLGFEDKLWLAADTLRGTYNPDWVVLVTADGKKVLLCQKTHCLPMSYTRQKKPKLHVAREHFNALGDGIVFAVKNTFERFSGMHV